MLVYRLSRTKHKDDLSGEGARLNGGRWNHKGTPALYTSESRALALLEYTVNTSIDDIPRALCIVSFEINKRDILEILESDLPGDWRYSPAPSSTKDLCSAILSAQRNLVIKISSTIIPEEFNYILNPIHPGMKNIKIVEARDFAYDLRIKSK